MNMLEQLEENKLNLQKMIHKLDDNYDIKDYVFCELARSVTETIKAIDVTIKELED